MHRVAKTIAIWAFFLFWLAVGGLQLLAWSGLRYRFWGEVPLLEMAANVLEDTLWLPIAIALPIYLVGQIRGYFSRAIAVVMVLIAAAVGFAFLVGAPESFRWLFLPIVLFFFFLIRRVCKERQLSADVFAYTLVILFLAGHYRFQLLPFSLSGIGCQEETLTAISYNISVSRPAEMRRQVIDQIQELLPDFVFIQEINSHDRTLFRRELGQAYPHQLWADRSENYNGGVILSRLPFELAENINVHTPYMSSHTNVNHAVVRLGERPIHLLNCHLYPSGHSFIRFLFGQMDATSFSRETQRVYQRRLVEAMQIFHKVVQISGTVVLAGDFNDTPNSRIYRLFSTELDNAYQQAGWGIGMTFGEQPLYQALHPRLKFLAMDFVRIDHIFCSPDVRICSARVLPLKASDHKPQIVKMRFTSASASTGR
ncbi:endonuclease/exonuclease/phosphatase family protein [candidate division KSB1 bacterium]|nr:endonuclease/exonuclease/phosphatase family protein [candidate division KSB1 bacterium]